MRRHMVLLQLLLSIGCHSGVKPAEITTSMHEGKVQVRLSGDIEADDLNRIRIAAGTAEQYELVLDSGGGDFQAGLEIARHVASKRITTIVPENGACFSACAFIFLAGQSDISGELPENEIAAPSRYIFLSSKLGLHSPYLEWDGPTSREVVEDAYEVAVRHISEIVSLTPTLNLDPQLLPTVLAKTRKQMFSIDTVEKAVRFDIPVVVRDYVVTNVTPPMAKHYCQYLVSSAKAQSASNLFSQHPNAYSKKSSHLDPYQKQLSDTTYQTRIIRTKIGDEFVDLTVMMFPMVWSNVHGEAHEAWVCVAEFYVSQVDGEGLKKAFFNAAIMQLQNDADSIDIKNAFKMAWTKYVGAKNKGSHDVYLEGLKQPAAADINSNVTGLPSHYALFVPPDTPLPRIVDVLTELGANKTLNHASSTNCTGPHCALAGGTRQSAAPPGSSLIQDLSVGAWTVNRADDCRNPAKIYSLNQAGANVIWRGGTGSVNEEKITFADRSTLVTVTTRSTSGTVVGTNWTYKRLPNGAIRVSTSGKKDFTLVACSVDRNRSSEMPVERLAKPTQSKGSASTSALLKSWSSLNERCRGASGNSPETDIACKQRERLSLELRKVGCVYSVGDKWSCN